MKHSCINNRTQKGPGTTLVSRKCSPFSILIFIVSILCAIYTLSACTGYHGVSGTDMNAPIEAEVNASGSDQLKDDVHADNVLYDPSLASASDSSAEEMSYTPPLEKPKTGNVFYFGSYPQSGSEPEPIAWRVLKVENDRALVISEMILECRAFNEDNLEITWKDCTLRSWLNNEFKEEAFAPWEQEGIITVTNKTKVNIERKYYTMEKSEDQIFCLSIEEVKEYMINEKDRLAAPTAFARKHGSFVNEQYTTADGMPATWWLLRSQGESIDLMNYVAYVENNGEINSYGRYVTESVSVRPAFWLKLN